MSLSAQLARSVRARGALLTVAGAQVIKAKLDQDVPRDTGELAKSQKVNYAHGPFVSSAMIEYPVKQAGFTNDGTVAHTIYPRGQVLAFEVDGRTVFARVVNHPGNRGTKWFTKATSAAAWRAALRLVAR